MILVTGGAGYIGSHFVKGYLKQFPSEQVVVVDNLSLGHKEALTDSNRTIFYQENIGNTERMQAILTQHKVQAVVHFAASCYVGESQQDPSKYFHNNTVNSLLLFEAMENAGVRRLVLSSTCATYGNPQHSPIDESHVQNPINVYGLTKFMLEKALTAYAETRKWSYVALRYFNAAGADEDGQIGESHDPESHIIPLALQTALGKRDILEIYGDDYDTEDGTCIRDYVHVSDLSTAHWQALQLTKAGAVTEAINLGGERGVSVKEIVDVCKGATGRNIKFKMSPRRSGDPPRLVANAKKAARVLGWRPRFDLEGIVRTAWTWEQSRRF